jgi:regulator of protease activity HflC (stomatin/prohibitin superfamily)
LPYPEKLLVTLAVLSIIVGYNGIRLVPEQERLAVLRLGRFIGARGPGIVMLIPFCDKVVRINLDHDVPNWRSLSAEELAQEIERRVTES